MMKFRKLYFSKSINIVLVEVKEDNKISGLWKVAESSPNLKFSFGWSHVSHDTISSCVILMLNKDYRQMNSNTIS